MLRVHWRTISACAGATLLASLPAFGQVDAPPALPDAASVEGQEAEFEVYNRGPIHEAFATPTTNDPVLNTVVDKAPPEPIDEVPPDERPEGDNVIWISGYWAYDAELDDFLWVSGLWRDAPPDRDWVPGYWIEAEAGFRWVAGMWVSAEVDEITYLPEPPPSQEQGASSPAPGENYFYVPGIWEWHDVDYRWRPGYWAPRQRDWIWVPSYYSWSPGGYIYQPGYWDYDLVNRGFVYAPIYFHGGFRGGFYQPRYALNTWQHLLLHLFVAPGYNHYVFGNYYDPWYADRGIMPWYRYGRQHRGYDPLFSYYNWRFGDQYVGRLDQWNDYFVANDRFRPRNTLREQMEFFRENRDNEVVARTQLAMDFEEIRASEDVPVTFARVNEQEREQIRARARSLSEFSRQRQQVEVGAEADADASVASPDADRTDRDAARADRQNRRTLELPRNIRRNADRAADSQEPGTPGQDQDVARPDLDEPADRPNATDPNATERPDATDRPDPTERPQAVPDAEERGQRERDRADRNQNQRDRILPDVARPESPDQMRDIQPDTPDGDNPRIPGRRGRTPDFTPDRTFPQLPDARTPDATPDRRTPDATPDRRRTPDVTPGNRPTPDATPDRNRSPERSLPNRTPQPERGNRSPSPSPREAAPTENPRPDRIQRETRRIPQPQAQPENSQPQIQPQRRSQQPAPSTDNRQPQRQSTPQLDRGNTGSRRSDSGARQSQRSSDRGNSSSGNRGNRGDRGGRGNRDR